MAADGQLFVIVSRWIPGADVQPGDRLKKLTGRATLTVDELRQIAAGLLGDEANDGHQVFWVDSARSQRMLLATEQQLDEAVRASEKYSSDDDGRFHPTLRVYAMAAGDYQGWQLGLAERRPSDEWRRLRQAMLDVDDEEMNDVVQAFRAWLARPDENHQASDDGGKTLLHMACALDLAELTRLLAGRIDAGARDADGMSCLHLAVLANNGSAVAALRAALDGGSWRRLVEQPVASTSGSRLVKIASAGQTAQQLAQSERVAGLLAT